MFAFHLDAPFWTKKPEQSDSSAQQPSAEERAQAAERSASVQDSSHLERHNPDKSPKLPDLLAEDCA
jgi:hypothetical protein